MAKSSNLVKKICPGFLDFQTSTKKSRPIFFGRGSQMAKFQTWFANIKEFKQVYKNNNVFKPRP